MAASRRRVSPIDGASALLSRGRAQLGQPKAIGRALRTRAAAPALDRPAAETRWCSKTGIVLGSTGPAFGSSVPSGHATQQNFSVALGPMQVLAVVRLEQTRSRRMDEAPDREARPLELFSRSHQASRHLVPQEPARGDRGGGTPGGAPPGERLRGVNSSSHHNTTLRREGGFDGRGDGQGGVMDSRVLGGKRGWECRTDGEGVTRLSRVARCDCEAAAYTVAGEGRVRVCLQSSCAL